MLGTQVGMDPPRFNAHSLQSFLKGSAVQRVLAAALDAVEPAAAVRRNLQRQANLLFVAGREYDLSCFRRVFIIGAGKAGFPMARAAASLVADKLSGGIVVVKDGSSGEIPGISLRQAGHPLPDERGIRAAHEIIDLLQEAGEDDLVICLISGGGSALLTAPAIGVALEDLQELTRLLLACGADINEINTLRKHLDEAKGGKLARYTHPARLATLILSDVIGDPLNAIASGPTVADPTTYQDALHVLERHDILGRTPPAILAHLMRGQAGKVLETPKPGEPDLVDNQNIVIANNRWATEAALERARSEGFNTCLLNTTLQGEARQAGYGLASMARQVAATGQPVPRPACLAAGGETTVTLRGDGLGGRNQEAALGAVAELAGLENVLLVTLATDGEDGPTDAAGAVVSGETLRRAQQAGMHPGDFLARNDAYHFFEPLGDLLITGPTLTNVNDLALIFMT
jgi:hydroxypyruvate reductase